VTPSSATGPLPHLASLFESVIHASSAIPPEAITL
jgi:hypothetical protein